MTTTDIFLWVVIPYVAITIFILGHVWRYRRDQFGWTSRSTQLLERRLLKWGGPLFHYGALAAIGGHVLGILIPQGATSAIGIDEHAYHLISAIAGTLAGAACSASLILIYRRASVRRVAVTIVRRPAVYARCCSSSRSGCSTRSRTTFRGRQRLQLPSQRRDLVPRRVRPPGPCPADGRGPARLPVRRLSASAILALRPFSRLVHAWTSRPVHRPPYILYRRRHSRPGLRTRIPEPHPLRASRTGARTDRATSVCGKTPSRCRALRGFGAPQNGDHLRVQKCRAAISAAQSRSPQDRNLESARRPHIKPRGARARPGRVHRLLLRLEHVRTARPDPPDRTCTSAISSSRSWSRSRSCSAR